MQQVAFVLKPSGEVYLTVDSAHWRLRFDPRKPVRLVKNLVRKGLSLLGKEQYYDIPWYDYEVATACKQARLEIVECRYYNMPILKLNHNHIVPSNRKNAFMRLWFEIEEFLNEVKVFGETEKNLFLGFYFHMRKSK